MWQNAETNELGFRFDCQRGLLAFFSEGPWVAVHCKVGKCQLSPGSEGPHNIPSEPPSGNWFQISSEGISKERIQVCGVRFI